MEIWKDVVGYEGLYQVSNLGNVKSLRTNKLIYYSYSGKYYKVGLFKEKRKSCSIHRLVAEAFIPNPNNYPCVNHKDCNKLNNCVENLEWCSYKYNNNYGTRNIKVKSALLLRELKTKCKDDKELIDLAIKLNDKIRKLPI